MMILASLLLIAQAAPVAVEEPVAPYTMNNTNAGGRPEQSGSLLAAFHGRAGIARIVENLVLISQADPRISDIFKGQDMIRLQRTLTEQFCYLIGGGCAYTGRDMASSHKDLGIQAADMNALVENLQVAMRHEGIPFARQNMLLAKLAPMKKQVVTR